MSSKETKYYGIYKNGGHVEKDSLSSVINLTDYEHIIKKDFHHEDTNAPPNYPRNYFKYTCVDENGIEKSIKIGGFECIDLGFEKGYYKFEGMICKILDVKNKTIHDFAINVFNTPLPQTTYLQS